MTKEQKVEVLKFLEAELLNTLKMVYLVEAEYRATTSMVMATSKPSTELLGAQTQAKRKKDALETKIRNLRGVIKEVQDDKLIV